MTEPLREKGSHDYADYREQLISQAEVSEMAASYQEQAGILTDPREFVTGVWANCRKYPTIGAHLVLTWKVESSSPQSREPPATRETGLVAYIHRGRIFFAIIAILTIGIATTLALVLLKLITAGP
jgi:hypothetical protein